MLADPDRYAGALTAYDGRLIARLRALQVLAWRNDLFLGIDTTTVLASAERPRCAPASLDDRLLSYRQPQHSIVTALTIRGVDLDDISALTLHDVRPDGTIGPRGLIEDPTDAFRLAARAPRRLRKLQGATDADLLLCPDTKTLARFVNDATADLGLTIAGRRVERQIDPTAWLKRPRHHRSRPVMPTIQLASLRDHRLMAGLSQRQLAKEAGIGFQTIRRLELLGDAGTVTLAILSQIATALGTTMPALLDSQPPSNARPSPGALSLTTSDARLLRKIATTPNAAATLSHTEREITLPRLLRAGLVTTVDDRLCLHPDTTAALTP